MGTDFQESNGCWDNLKLGPMVFGTKYSWDISFLGQISGFSDIFGTKSIGTKCYWDNSPSD